LYVSTGGTTPANWTTTGSGDLVSADDLTVADDTSLSSDVFMNASSGSTTIYGSLTSGDAAGDVFDHNGDLAKFGGAADGLAYVYQRELNFGYDQNATYGGLINFRGYNAGATQFRDLTIYDGKNATVATFTGSDKSLAVVGDLSSSGDIILTQNTNSWLKLGSYEASPYNTALIEATSSGASMAFRVNGGDAVTIANSGQVWLGDTASTAVSSNLDVLTVGQTGTGMTTAGKALIYGTNTGTYSTTGGDVTAYVGNFVTTATESGGSGAFFNIAVHAYAQGGDDDIALWADNGRVLIDEELTAERITPPTKLFDYSRGTEFFDDFFASPINLYLADVSNTLTLKYDFAGTGWHGEGNVALADPVDSSHPGVIYIQARPSTDTLGGGVAAPANGRIVQGYTTGNGAEGAVWWAGNGAAKGSIAFMIDGTNSPPIDDVDSYTITVGMFDWVASTGGTGDKPEDGIFCRADSGSANWQTCTCEANTCTCNATSPAVSITEDDWVKCEWTVSADGLTVDFTVTDSGASGSATHITNIPNDVTHPVGLGASVDRVDNAGSGTVFIDYAWFDHTFTATR
jgi:hypothetical protein